MEPGESCGLESQVCLLHRIVLDEYTCRTNGVRARRFVVSIGNLTTRIVVCKTILKRSVPEHSSSLGLSFGIIDSLATGLGQEVATCCGQIVNCVRSRNL